MEEKENEKVQTLPAEVRADILSKETSLFMNVAKFEHAFRIANMFANSTMVPAHFRGNPGNCMIALNYASRLGADEFMVMQSMYEVHGRPGIEGKLVEALINASGKYRDPLAYQWLDPDDKETTRAVVLKNRNGGYGCQAFTVDARSNKPVTGPKIDWELIKGMGWYDKKGPDKRVESNFWRNMTEMMFYYRCASWFANKNCPEVKLGMHTVEELRESVIDITPGKTLKPPETPPVEPGKDIYTATKGEKGGGNHDDDRTERPNVTTPPPNGKKEKMWECQACHSSFLLEEDLNEHIKEQHAVKEKSLFDMLKGARTTFCKVILENIDETQSPYTGPPVRDMLSDEINYLKNKWEGKTDERWPLDIEEEPPPDDQASPEDQSLDDGESDNTTPIEELTQDEGFVRAMQGYQAELGPPRFNRVLSRLGYKSFGEVGPTDMEKVNREMSSELDLMAEE